MIAAKRKILSDNCQLKTLLCFTETIGFKQWLQDFESSGTSFLQLGHIAISIFYSLSFGILQAFLPYYTIKYYVLKYCIVKKVVFVNLVWLGFEFREEAYSSSLKSWVT